MHVGNDTTSNARAEFDKTNQYGSYSDKADSESKNSTDSAKDSSQNNQDGTASDLQDSDTVLSIPFTDDSRKHTHDTKFYRYEVKQHKKMVRILTVIAYVICVSMAAIVLSLYYVFLWDPYATKYKGFSDNKCEKLLQEQNSDVRVLALDSPDIHRNKHQLQQEAELAKCVQEMNEVSNSAMGNISTNVPNPLVNGTYYHSKFFK